MDGNTALGASSPANPALHIPEPLSTTKAATSSSHIFEIFMSTYRSNKNKNLWFNVSSKRFEYEKISVEAPTNTEHLIIWNDEERAAVLCLNTDCSHG